MAITAKPVAYTLNSGATYYPDHLWMMDEGSGTTLNDVIGSIDLTLSGPDWATDGTHGPYLEFVGANSDVATYTNGSAEPIAGINTSFTVAVLMQSASKTGGSAEGLAFIYDSTSGSGKFGFQSGAEGYVGYTAQQTGGTQAASTGAAWGAVDTGEWVWAMMAINSTGNGNGEGSANGNGTNGSFATVNLISNSGTMDSFGLGAILDSTPAGYFTGKIAAVALWANTFYDEATQLAIYNSGNVWASLGVEPATGHPALSRHRGIPGMNTIASRFGRGW